jgi:dolichyl-phosphate-mannose-protein mannosyltransferase
LPVPLLERLNRPAVAILAVAAIACGIRLWGLSHPSDLVFDEFYYAKAACILVGDSDRVCRVESDTERLWRRTKWDVGSWTHPPLGKWMIAIGQKTFGMDPFGWRVSSAVAGTATAVLVAVIAHLLFGGFLWTFVSGLLMAIDSLNVVFSRLALLDVHLEFWIVLGFLFLVLDRRWIDRRTARRAEANLRAGSSTAGASVDEPSMPVPSPVWRPWRFAAGLAFGAAVSVKWSGAMAILGALVLSYAWETTRRRAAGSPGHAFARALGRETFGLVLAFVLVPVVVYFAAYAPWFHHFGWSLRDWWENQTAMFQYHRQLKTSALDPSTSQYTPTHPYYSRPWTWLPMLRPVNFFSPSAGGAISQILAVGNPALFWGTLWTLPYTAYAWRRRRDWRAGLLVVGFLAQYLPWLVISRPQFFFYILPATPFMALAAAYTLRDLATATIVLRDPGTGERVESTRHPFLPFVWGYLIAAVALFVWFWPVLTAHPLTQAMWRARVWFRGWV